MIKVKNRINLILPKRRVKVGIKELLHARLYFLAGPIRGASGGYGYWQAKAIEYLAAEDPGCYIVCPCRYSPNQTISENWLALQEHGLEENAADSIPEFASQTLWERYYLERAARYGTIIFWLAEEDKINPRPKDQGPYGRDTYGEQGEWRIRSKYNIGEHGLPIINSQEIMNSLPKLNVVIGGEAGFSGIDVIEKNWKDVHGADFVLHKSLERTIDAAITKALTI